MSPAPGGALGALESSGLGRAMREWLWLYPSVEIAHIVGIGLLFGSIAVLDLRLLGVSRHLSARTLARHVLPWTAASFLLIVPSGLAMFTAHATEFIQSDVFVLKMLLIMAAGLNAALFHAITFRTADVWDAEEMRRLPPPPSARLAGALPAEIYAAAILRPADAGRGIADQVEAAHDVIDREVELPRHRLLPKSRRRNKKRYHQYQRKPASP